MQSHNTELNSHLISMYLCNPFQGCVVLWCLLTTGASSELPADNNILPIPGKIPIKHRATTQSPNS